MISDARIEHAARAIWKKRPDVGHKPWPYETEKERRAYMHNPIMACELSLEYAKAALEADEQFTGEK